MENRISISKQSLAKLEGILSRLGYIVRYEKGNFRTGACIILNSKVVVVNRFLDLEAKITALVDLLVTVPTDHVQGELDEKQRSFLWTIKQKKLGI